jgi:lysozyme family protein
MIYSVLFDKCLPVILNNEGGFSNNPADPGGPTNHGITQRVYDEYRKQKGLVLQSVKFITDIETSDIYYTKYWLPMNLEDILDELLVLQVFDMGVNAGTGTSIKILQRMVKTTDDGKIGPNTLRAIEDYDGKIAKDFIVRRKLFYLALVKAKPALKKFLNGWLNRIEKTKFN